MARLATTEPDLPVAELISTVRRPGGGVWTTMLHVDIQTGEVLVNRLSKIGFGSYTAGSAFEDRNAKAPGYDRDVASRRRVSGRIRPRGRRR